jgi:hypothetical protein
MDLVAESKRSAGKRERNRRGTIAFGDRMPGDDPGDKGIMPIIEEDDGSYPSSDKESDSDAEPPFCKQARRSQGAVQSCGTWHCTAQVTVHVHVSSHCC